MLFPHYSGIQDKNKQASLTVEKAGYQEKTQIRRTDVMAQVEQ